MAWLRDAKRPRAEERAAAIVPAAAAVSRRRLVLLPEHRRLRGRARGRPGPAAPRATAGAGRPSAVPGRNREPVAAAWPAVARPVTARGVTPGHRQPMVRAGPLVRPPPMGPVAPLDRQPPTVRAGLRGHPRPKARAGPLGPLRPMEPVGPLDRRPPKDPGGPLPTERAGVLVRPRPKVRAARRDHPRGRDLARQRAGRSAPEPAAPEPAALEPAAPEPRAPVRVPAPSTGPRPAARMRVQPERALALSEGRGPDPAQAGREGIDGRPPVPHAGLGTGTRTGTLSVRGLETELQRAGVPPTGPPRDPAPLDPAPSGLAPTGRAPNDPAPTGRAPNDPAPTDLAPNDPAPTDPAAQGPDRTTRRGAVRGCPRSAATARRTGPEKTGPANSAPATTGSAKTDLGQIGPWRASAIAPRG